MYVRIFMKYETETFVIRWLDLHMKATALQKKKVLQQDYNMIGLLMWKISFLNLSPGWVAGQKKCLSPMKNHMFYYYSHA